MKKPPARNTRATCVNAVFSPDNPRVLCGGAKDAAAAWICTVTHRDTGKKLAPSRVAVVDFPPSSESLLVYSMPADHEILGTGVVGWRFSFRGDQIYAGDPPATHALKLKVWVDGLGWNYSDDAWTFNERVVEGNGRTERMACKQPTSMDPA